MQHLDIPPGEIVAYQEDEDDGEFVRVFWRNATWSINKTDWDRAREA
jgi:hypothetical protein